MAKQHQSGGERSKVKIFFVEADLASGDMEQLTQALMSAIKPAQIVGRNPTVRQLSSGAAPGETVEVAEVEDADDVEEAPPNAGTPRRPYGQGPKRQYRKPETVNLDMMGNGNPFEGFAKAKGPTSHRERYLVAASWLHDVLNLKVITADHVYTCYLAAEWPFDVDDPNGAFRKLKGKGRGSLDGRNFSINHQGLADVRKMKAA